MLTEDSCTLFQIFTFTDKKTLKSISTFQCSLQGQKDSNPRHLVLETNVLPTELYPYIKLKIYTFKTSYRIRINPTFWSSPQTISNSQLHVLPHFHLCPIYLVLFKGFTPLKDGISHLGDFTLRCLQRLFLPTWLPGDAIGMIAGTPGPSSPVRTKASSFRYPTPAPDRDRTVSRRSELQLAYRFNGRTAQPLGPATAPGCDASRHRGAKTTCRCELWE